jgi:hypothetical protein
MLAATMTPSCRHELPAATALAVAMVMGFLFVCADQSELKHIYLIDL